MFVTGFRQVTEAVAGSATCARNMKTAIFLVGGVLVAYSLFLSEAAVLARSGRLVEDDLIFADDNFNSTQKYPNCTQTIDHKPPIVVRYI